MKHSVETDNLSDRDVTAITGILLENHDDTSLFLRSQQDVSANRSDFIVAKDDSGRVVGCAAIHRYGTDLAELLSVAVLPELHGAGIGSLLVSRSLQTAHARGITTVWLATAKPTYFARFGFKLMSRWALPVAVLLNKLQQVFQQPVARWLPSLFSRFVFMARDLHKEAA